MGRPRTVYRGKRRHSWLITLITFIVVIVAMLAAVLFYSLQKYIVYEKDGLSLELPSAQGEAAAEPDAPVEPDLSDVVAPPTHAEIVIGLPDFSELEQMAGEGLDNVKAQYVTAEKVSASNLPYYAAAMEQSGGNALMLQMKNADGFLSYASGIAMTASYGVNGTEVLFEQLSSLKEDGVYLMAEISCLVDNAMASRNTPLAMKNAVTGGVLSDSSGSWLDPYNDSCREYLAELLGEMADMGFDEVVLRSVAYPQADNVQFSKTMTAVPDPVSCVSSLVLYLRELADQEGIRLSVVVNSGKLREGKSSEAGQDLELFFKAFDRIYVETDYNFYNADITSLQNALGHADAKRIVPITTGYIPEAESWTVQ